MQGSYSGRIESGEWGSRCRSRGLLARWENEWPDSCRNSKYQISSKMTVIAAHLCSHTDLVDSLHCISSAAMLHSLESL